MARTEWLDQFKGIGILFIVLGHLAGAAVHLSHDMTQAFFAGVYKYFYAFHVPLFFVVAGMTFKKQDWGRFLKNKFLRLLIPYFVFGLFSAIVYSFCSSSSAELLNATDTTGYYRSKTEGVSFCTQLLNLLLGGFIPNGFVGNSVLWFLPALFTVELTAQVLVRLRCSLIPGWTLGVLFLIGSFSCFVWINTPRLPWSLHTIPKYLPYFILGAFIGLRNLRWGGGRCLLLRQSSLFSLACWQF